MNPTPAIGLIIALCVLWYAIRDIRYWRKRDRAQDLIDHTERLREKGHWLARMYLRETYAACYDAGMIERYQDLHEWFYGRGNARN